MEGFWLRWGAFGGCNGSYADESGTSRTFKDCVTDQRIGIACRHLLETNRNISEIAYAAG